MDGSADSLRALPIARELAEREGGRVVAVHVRELFIGRAGGQPVHVNEGEIEADVRRTVEQLVAEGLEVTMEVGTSKAGGPAPVLAAIAAQKEADLIVVGTRGHGQMAGILLGSVTQRLLHIAPCPVLAVPPTRVAGSPSGNVEATAAAH